MAPCAVKDIANFPGGRKLDSGMMVAPYMARRADERHADWRDVTVSDGRVCYVDEVPADRDTHGVLWVRQPGGGTGRVVFGQIHSQRQRHASLALLCQVCGDEPDENEDGVLWLLPTTRDVLRARFGTGPVLTPYPPVCASCCAAAIRQCPPLRAGHAVLRAADVSVYGVYGKVFQLDAGRLMVSDQCEFFSYDDPNIGMVVAAQQALSLMCNERI
jgi:hypothetical protein